MARQTFLRITTRTGEKYVSEFTKLVNVQRYASQVFIGQKPFNVWRVVGDVHPQSGERVLVRQRVMLNGRDVLEVEHVQRKPDVDANTMDAADFEPVAEIQSGQGGLWTAPEQNTPEHAVAGVRYPVHINPQTLRPYVILQAEREEPAVEEIRYEIPMPERPGHRFGGHVNPTVEENDPPSQQAEGPGDGDEDILPNEFDQE